MIDMLQRLEVSLAALSGSRPLAIELENNNDEDLMGLKSVIAHRVRWERLTLRISSSTANVLRTAGPMPLLRYLDIESISQDTSTSLTFLDAPVLRTVVFDYEAAAKIPVPWAQTTSLTLHYIYPYECVPILAPILAQGLDLVYCELLFVYSQENRDMVLDFTPLDPYHEYPIGLLASFIVPALRTLQIPAWFFGPTPLDELRAFISKAGCKLQKLHIVGKLEHIQGRVPSRIPYRLCSPVCRYRLKPSDSSRFISHVLSLAANAPSLFIVYVSLLTLQAFARLRATRIVRKFKRSSLQLNLDPAQTKAQTAGSRGGNATGIIIRDHRGAISTYELAVYVHSGSVWTVRRRQRVDT
ncbi:hypothetical protein C8F04DRAFT_1199240 [Mycena alexandri]|uniref:Uncharacterized protein n=1 Tax=Mycena alexandri TaxID=1745969 RepID=A0AAD6S0S2_9AGAR|nr:hypothetical protein C8F04DRAFT_1199240 [Mycena alexandri]